MNKMTHFDKISRSITRQAPPPAQLREEELDLLGIFRLIRRRIWLILAVSAVVVALALPSILSMQRPYYGQSRLLIQKPLTSSLVTEGNAPPTPLDPNTEVERLLARGIAVKVAQEFHLDRLEEFNPTLAPVPLLDSWVDGIRRWVRGEGPAEPPTADDVMETVIANYYDALNVRRSGTTDVIEIGFSSLDPELAAAVPNALVQIYLEARESGAQGRVSEAEAWLAPRIEAQRARLNDALAAVKAFRENSGLVSDDARADAARSISTLTERRSTLVTERADLAATLTSLESKVGQPEAAEAVDTDTMASLRRSLQQQQAQLARLLQTYGENYGPVLDARSAIRETQAAISGEVDRTVQSLRAKLASYDREDAAITAGLESAHDTLARLNVLQNQLGVLQAAADRERTALDALEDQRRELESQGGVPVAEAEILSPAAVPMDPAGRGRLIYLIGAMFAAGSIGVTVAFLREMLDSGLRSPQQLRTPGALPGGLIPKLTLEEAGDIAKVLRQKRGGMFADVIRHTIHALERGNDGVFPRSLLVSSALPGEGKSLIAAAIAIELAASGRSVLLVDADLVEGRVHQLFGAEPAPGMNEYLSGEVDAAGVIRQDPRTRVAFVARGSSETYATLHEPRQLEKLMQLAATRGDIVIFDSAPVLAMAETTLLAGVAERSLMLVRWGKTHRRAADLAIQRLVANSPADVLTVVNAVDLKRHALYGFHDAGMFAGRVRKYYPNRT